MPTRKTTEEFIAQAQKVHGDKYDYSLVVYVDSLTPVTIRCPEHFCSKVNSGFTRVKHWLVDNLEPSYDLCKNA